MKLLSPLNLIFTIFMPIIILMYILKQKFEEREISSLYLWELTIKDMDVNTPWQRLKKNILMFLQLVAVLLIILSLCNPYLLMNGGENKKLIIVIDNTGSMNARYDNQTRFDVAKTNAMELIKNSASGGMITIMTTAIHPKVEIATNNKSQALAKLKAINASNSKGDINEVLSLIAALVKQDSSARSVIYTDSPLNMEGVNGKLVSMVLKCENVSLDYISHSIQDKKLKVMVRATNRNQDSVTREISLYGDGKLLTIAQIEIVGMGTKTIYFDDIPEGNTYLSAEITEKDDLIEDNIIYEVVKQFEKKKVLLVSEKNIFLERAFSSINNIELFKTRSIDDKSQGYDLYIFDGILPDTMPVKGSFILLNPPVGKGIIEVNGNVEGGAASVQTHPLTRLVENAKFDTASIKKTNVPSWAEVLIKVGENPGVMLGNMNGRKICIINFDLHNSEFPLTPEFPILMYNISGYLIGTSIDGKTSYNCGEGIQLELLPDVETASMTIPSGSEEGLEIKYPAIPFDNTNEIGIYKLTQITKDREYLSLLGVNFPTAEESAVKLSMNSVENSGIDKVASTFGKSIQFPFILILIGLMVLEWAVYTRGY